VNRSYCIGLGDISQLLWPETPEWQKTSCLKGVEGVLGGNGPEQSHNSWLEEKLATGWKYRPVKDPEKKEHPCFLSYDELPTAQRFKNTLFVTTVRGILSHYGLMSATSTEK
jgi:hypothetical protein